jgi:hypothetical protein
MKKMHIFSAVNIRNKGDYTAIAQGIESESDLLHNLAAHAVKGALAILKLAADSDPFIMVFVVYLLYSVKHKIGLVLLYIA